MSVSKQSENILCVRASVLGILACIKETEGARVLVRKASGGL